MLIEQAFFNLPEILVGSRYPTQDYEGGVVAAFSMAVLQELNGRNANNPISHLIAERIYQIERVQVQTANAEKEWKFRYQVDPFREATNDKPRYLRADLHVSLGGLRTGSAALSRYGWRHSNWIEAKFFRDCFKSHSPTKPANGGQLAADLVRLMALPPIELPKKNRPTIADGTVTYQGIFTGRYLLHLYQGTPFNYQALRRNKSRDKPGGKRKWLESLLAPGNQSIEGLDLGNEGDTFMTPINQALGDIGVTASVTNFVLKPLSEEAREDAYWCVLSRIDSFKISHGKDSWEVKANQTAIESSAGAFDRIRCHVGNHVHAKEKVEEATPGQPDLNAEDEDADDEEIQDTDTEIGLAPVVPPPPQ